MSKVGGFIKRNKTFKGMVAMGFAALLLLGGAGSLAFWTASGTVSGAAIDTGQLALSTPSCGDWTLDAAGGGGTFTPGTTLLVPGDVITEDCTTTLTATGAHMSGTIDAGTPPTVTGAPDGTFTVSVGTVTDVTQGGTLTTFTDTNNGDQLSIEVQVTFVDPGTADNSTQNLTAELGDITLTATQSHP